MIKFEHNTLVLDASHTKDDQQAINDFIEYLLNKQKEEIENKTSSNPNSPVSNLSK
jgi:hypothetical protein